MKEDGCVDEVGGNHTIMNQCGRSEMKKGGIHTRERACFFFLLHIATCIPHALVECQINHYCGGIPTTSR
jgi:hypothetical protein